MYDADRWRASELNNVHDKLLEHYFSSKRDFTPSPEGIKLRYVLCSSPRSGSTLISDMLYRIGLAGDPLEYFNKKLLDYYQKHYGKTGIDAYLEDIERRRTSPNGIFGIKLHYYQAAMVWKGRESEGLTHLARYDKKILITRRDKIAQAVSLYRAQKTQIWSSEDKSFMSDNDPRKKIEVPYDPVRIAYALSQLINEEAGWRNLLEQAGIPFTEICYETYVADYEKQSAKLLQSLGVNLGEEQISAPTLKKQSENIDPMIERFKRDLGLI